MTVRRVLIVAVAFLLAAQIVRNAVVSALAETNPAAAARIWPDHPDVELSLGMTAIGAATHRGQPAGETAFKMIDDAALKAPLAPEPFLVRGVQAQLSGQASLARQAFLAAEWRDPRSLPARFFLAEQFFRAGDVRRGLNELAALARLSPNGTVSVAPFIAAYAKDPSHWPQLRGMLRSDDRLEEPVLYALASDPANAAAVLALADPKRSHAGNTWLGTLLAGLVNAGQYAEARAIWAEVARVRNGRDELIHDAGFADAVSPPPFNWTLTSSTVGLAERVPGGRLHVIYYGQEDGVLAKQLLLLPPATYRMAMRLSGDASRAHSLSWALTCVGSQTPLAAIRFDMATGRPWLFRVPADCPAQYLELAGASSDIAQQTDVAIGGLSLTRGPGNG